MWHCLWWLSTLGINAHRSPIFGSNSHHTNHLQHLFEIAISHLLLIKYATAFTVAKIYNSEYVTIYYVVGMLLNWAQNTPEEFERAGKKAPPKKAQRVFAFWVSMFCSWVSLVTICWNYVGAI